MTVASFLVHLTKVGNDTAVLLHRVFKPLKGVVDGAEGKDDLGQFALQRLQLVVVDRTSNNTVAI